MAPVSTISCLLAAVLAILCLAASGEAAQPPLRSQAEIEAYVSSHASDLQDQLQDYNREHGLVRGVTTGLTKVLSAFWTLQRFDGDRVFLIGRITAGKAAWDATLGRLLFEFQWQGGELKLVGHGKPPARQPGVVDDDGRGGQRCVYNYFAPNPCLDTARRWTEFSEIYGLPKNRESAEIFEAFAQEDVRIGERLLASALGEPPPVTESVYELQAEVDALNLGRYQTNMENPCDLDAYGTKPCPEIDRVYHSFIASHGLPEGAATAQMFAAYAVGDFRRGDTIYALASNKPIPHYDEPTTTIGRDAAVAGLRPASPGEAGDCSLNPYGVRPCLDSVAAWQTFRARYQLADTAESARIFEAYAEGDFTAGDQLFAQAKDVSVAQLLEAAGVPSEKLVIEVYPGRGR
ncbi:hypothetical protein SAMN06265365_11178 [Tistlia consotensis]|uniref:Uncharacterized protein n=1 Tax=Tistlia consotensis USBA 355 TaxID=560819 RepID=A0A1Y6BXF1_9PROT|nr:hypothetical protein [Tistlia consotensis]SMF32917.1 hypothetical protein SAMN05428998_11179 [Tistlia consotensis USBA 355]SNR69097.1 hypothetical protein SAMN06265365_11178 [Tistlia consotensis]